MTAARHTASHVADDPGDGADVYMPRRRYRRKHRDSVTCSGAAATRTHQNPALASGVCGNIKRDGCTSSGVARKSWTRSGAT